MTSTERSRARRARMTSNERTAYQAKYTVKWREDLIRLLAPDCRCAICGEVFDPPDLEIDHVDGITWDHDLLSSHRRVARYWREYESGVKLRALCRSDSRSDGIRWRGHRRY